MKYADVAVIGGGPAGLRAEKAASDAGARVLLLERNGTLGGQLVKQTHRFFGSEKQYASHRGIDICKILQSDIDNQNVEILTDATVLGLYEDGVLTVEHSDKYLKVKPSAIVVATGASEKFLPFPNNDLPGICGAGAVQTLMNVYGVLPGNSVVMVGAGNIGLIVSYQLIQAGVKVNAVVDAAPVIGGYSVHAAKLARMGVPIFTGTTVKRALGKDCVEGVVLVRLNEHWQEIEGSEFTLPCDNLCISVGLSPLCELLWQLGCEMKYVPVLGGYVPIRNGEMQTTADKVFVAGDVAGIEEASSAMVEGFLAGLCAAKSAGFVQNNYDELLLDCKKQLDSLRGSNTGKRIADALNTVTKGEDIC